MPKPNLFQKADKPAPKPKQVVQPKPEPVVQPKPEPVVEPKPEPVVEPMPEPSVVAEPAVLKQEIQPQAANREQLMAWIQEEEENKESE